MTDNISDDSSQKSIEVEGQTVDEAIKKAMKLFDVSREELNVKVVSEEKRGLFGMEGAKPAKIKAWLKNSDNNT